jgi:hypothetical protein
MPSYTSSTPQERPDHVEPGDYQVEVIDAIETVSKGGHEMIELKLRTSAGSLLFDFLVFIPTAFWKIDAFRRALGHEVVQGEPVELAAEDLIGRTLRARLKVEEFNGRANNKVEAWLAPLAASGSAPAPAPRASAPTAPATKQEDSANEPF